MQARRFDHWKCHQPQSALRHQRWFTLEGRGNAATGLTTLLALVFLSLWAGCSEVDTSSVVLVDVGYGSALLCRHQDGMAVLVDGGYAEEIDAVETALTNAGIDSLALIVSTHGHGDHLEGITLLLERLWPVGEVAGNVPWGHGSYDPRFWELLQGRNIPYRQFRGGQNHEVNPFYIKAFHPDTLSRDLNESSLVFSIDLGDATLMISADIGMAIQERLAHRYREQLAADILLLPHHGDHIHPAFLDAISPTWGLLSVGPNPWELPTPVTFSELRRRSIRLIDTRTLGTTKLEITRDGIIMGTHTGPSGTVRREVQMDERIRRWTSAH